MGLLFRPRRPLLRLATADHQATQAPPPPQPTPAALTDQEFAAAKVRALGI